MAGEGFLPVVRAPGERGWGFGIRPQQEPAQGSPWTLGFTHVVGRTLPPGRAEMAWRCYSFIKAQKCISGAGRKAPIITPFHPPHPTPF